MAGRLIAALTTSRPQQRAPSCLHELRQTIELSPRTEPERHRRRLGRRCTPVGRSQKRSMELDRAKEFSGKLKAVCTPSLLEREDLCPKPRHAEVPSGKVHGLSPPFPSRSCNPASTCRLLTGRSIQLRHNEQRESCGRILWWLN